MGAQDGLGMLYRREALGLNSLLRGGPLAGTHCRTWGMSRRHALAAIAGAVSIDCGRHRPEEFSASNVIFCLAGCFAILPALDEDGTSVVMVLSADKGTPGPERVKEVTHLKSVSAGPMLAIGVKEDGSAWAYGASSLKVPPVRVFGNVGDAENIKMPHG